MPQALATGPLPGLQPRPLAPATPARADPGPTVVRMAPAALAKLQKAREERAKQSAAKPSLAMRAAAALSKQQFSVTAGVPGTGRAVNGPLRAGVPGQVHAGVGGTAGILSTDTHAPPASTLPGRAPVLQDAADLLKIVQAMQASVHAAEVKVYERPAGSPKHQLATRAVPWLGATSLRETTRLFHGKDKRLPAAATRKDPAAERSRDANTQQALQLQQHLGQRRTALDEAHAASADAKTQLASARQALEAAPANSPQRVQAQAALTQAEAGLKSADASVAAARQSLHQALHGTDLLALKNQNRLSDRTDAGLAFSSQRLDDLKPQIAALRATAEARSQAIDVALQAHARQANDLKSRPDPAPFVKQATTHFNELKLRHDTLVSSGADLQTPPAIALARDFRQARTTLDDALDMQTAYREGLDRLSDLNGTVDALMRERSVVATSLTSVKRAESSLDEVEKALAQRKDKADPLAPATATREADAIKAAHAQIVEQLVQLPPAFAAQPPCAELQTQLRLLAGKLTAPKPPMTLPADAVLELVTRSMADVGADASQAARMLEQLAQHPVTHWMALAAAAPPADGAAGAAAGDDTARILAMCRKLSTLPRGGAILQTLSSEGTKKKLEPAQSQALRAFWNADGAQRSAPPGNGDTVQWLQQAKNVARAQLTPVAGVEFDDVDHAAFNAVRNGYLSNAPGTPYDAHNQRLKKSITEWVIRASGDKAGAADGAEGQAAAKPSLFRRAMPNLNKTPFTPRLMKQAYATGESMGLHSPRIQVDQAVRARITDLERTIATCSEAPGTTDALKNDIAAAQAVIDHLQFLEKNNGKHLSQISLKAGDRKAVGQRVPTGLSDTLTGVCGSGLTAYEALQQIKDHLVATSPPGLHPAANDAAAQDPQLEAAIQLLKSERMSDRKDVLTFFNSFIENGRLRDRLRMGGGGAAGLNLPNLPYGAASPIASPILTAEMSRTDEAFVQLFVGKLGMEMSFGAAHTRAKEATVGVAVGPQIAPGVSVQGTFTARAASQQTQTDSTTLRFFRKRGKEDEMRSHMQNALDSMVRWDLIEPTRGRAYKDPLEAVFARNPDVVVTHLEGSTDTRTLTARLSARLPTASFAHPDGTAQTLGLEASVFAEAERVRAGVSETGGTARVFQSRSDTAQQRLGGSANLNFSPLSNQPVTVPQPGTDGQVTRQSVPMQLGISRDFAWAKEQHDLFPYQVDNKQECDLDRHYATPAEMLTEIAGNHEQWLMRCVDTLGANAEGEKNTPENRLRASLLLDRFEKELAALGTSSNTAHYNVSYSMRGEVGASVDGYRAMAELASQRGDHEEVKRAQQAIDDVLLMRSTWQPSLLIVRERARDATTLGWRSLLRLQQVANVDVQRTGAQFPPP